MNSIKYFYTLFYFSRLQLVLLIGVPLLVLNISAIGQSNIVVIHDTLHIISLQKARFPTDIVLTNSPYENTLEKVISKIGYCKSYGDGSLSSPSIRGGSASHTLVTWNGIPITNPMLGQLDLSLLSGVVGDRFHIIRGGGATMYSSGSIAGTIDIINEINQIYPNYLTSKFGSYGLMDQSFSVSLQSKRLHSITKINARQSNRDFTVELSPNVYFHNSNARYSRNNFLQHLYWVPSSNIRFNAHFWYSKNFTKIPPTSVQNKSLAYQYDESLKSLIHFTYLSRKWQLHFKHALIKDVNEYVDPIIITEATNRFLSTTTELSAKKYINDIMLESGISFIHSKARSTGYDQIEEDFRLLNHITASYHLSNMNMVASLRGIYHKDKLLPLMPVASIFGKLTKNIDFFIKVSKDIRIPTLNELYWKPGGNENILPEHGWVSEYGFNIALNKLIINSTYFYRLIDNWILWVPSSSAYWEPKNVNKVKSYGIEQRIQWKYNTSKIALDLVLHYFYTSSTYQSNIVLPIIKIGDQLPYMPKHRCMFDLQVIFHSLELKYSHSVVSSSHGINNNVNAYDFGDVELSYSFYLRFQKAKLIFNINNLWNSKYYIVERRPLPPRNYSLTLNLTF